MDTQIILTDREIRNFLRKKAQGDDIAAEVAQEALEHISEGNGEAKHFFSGLARHGCVSGWISRLIWYTDTHAFFDRHYEEIEDIRYRFTDQDIHPMICGDLKNFYAWLAFEEVAYEMAQELGLD